MSWIQQESRRRQGSWVASMPRPQLVGARQACPLVGLVGACCSGCAEGKGCSGKDELHAAQTPIVGESAIPWADVAKTNATIESVQEAAGALASAPQGSPELRRYMLWSLFYSTWTIWYAAAKAGAEHDLANGIGAMFGFGGNMFIHGDMADTYVSLVLSFNENLKALQAEGVKATAEPVDTRSPAGKAFDKLVNDVLGGSAGALGFLGTALTWVAVAGAVGLGLYYGGPLLFGMLRKAKK